MFASILGIVGKERWKRELRKGENTASDTHPCAVLMHVRIAGVTKAQGTRIQGRLRIVNIALRPTIRAHSHTISESRVRISTHMFARKSAAAVMGLREGEKMRYIRVTIDARTPLGIPGQQQHVFLLGA